MPNSGKPGETQSIQTWMKLIYDFKGLKSFLAKYPEKQLPYQHHPWSQL